MESKGPNETHTESPEPQAALRLENVSKVFTFKGQEIEALRNLTCHVRTNEFVALLGPSACGKTTTFNIIAGLLEPTNGRVYIDGRDVTGETGHVGYMFQKDLLLPWRTVLGNVILGAEALSMDRRDTLREAREIVRRLGLAGFENHYPAQISGGMRQRVAFGRTLLLHKEVLLLDEPLGALDAQTREYMQEWLLDVWEQFRKTVFLVTHDLDEAIFLADRIYVMTCQPGRTKAEIAVDLPRPRQAKVRLSPTYSEIRHLLYELIRAEEAFDWRADG